MGLDHEPLLINDDDVEMGGEDSIKNDFAYRNNVANGSLKIRMAFIRKVYCLLTAQLALTIIISAVALHVPVVKFYILNNDWTILLGFVATICFLIAITIYRKQHPHNLMLLAGFTIAQAYTIAVAISRFDTVTIFQAVCLTFIVVLGLTFYTFQSRRDFSSVGAGFSAFLSIILFGSILQLFLNSNGLELMLSCGGAFLFSLFIIYDTQLILQKLSPEEYILATITLYMDVINLFLYILRILAESTRQ